MPFGSPRLRICLVVPGRDLRPGSSHTRSVLTLARALALESDVTAVFRRVPDECGTESFEIGALEGGPPRPGPDVAPSRRALGLFAELRAADFDVVLEGSWSMSGKLTAWCAQRGVPAIPLIDQLAPSPWLDPLDLRHNLLAFGASGRYLRRAPSVIAGSEALRNSIVDRWRVEADRIAVIGPAVDGALFAPVPQAEARRRLGLGAEHRIVVAGDGLGPGPSLVPLIGAVQRAGDPTLRLHILGDGTRRRALERLAGQNGAITFHGQVPDDLVAAHIAAADLCVSVNEHGGAAFTALECLTAGRPVAIGTENGRGHPLIHHLVSGFLVDHSLLAWIRFLQRDCPSRKQLQSMGIAAASSPMNGPDWVAAAYLEAIEGVCRGALRRVDAR